MTERDTSLGRSRIRVEEGELSEAARRSLLWQLSLLLRRPDCTSVRKERIVQSIKALRAKKGWILVEPAGRMPRKKHTNKARRKANARASSRPSASSSPSSSSGFTSISRFFGG